MYVTHMTICLHYKAYEHSSFGWNALRIQNRTSNIATYSSCNAAHSRACD